MFKRGQISNKFIQKTFEATLSINFCKIFARYWIPFISRPSLTNGNMTLVWFPKKNVTKRDDIRCILSRVTANSTVRWEQVPKYMYVYVYMESGGKNTQTNTSCAPSCEYSCVELLSGPYLFGQESFPYLFRNVLQVFDLKKFFTHSLNRRNSLCVGGMSICCQNMFYV